MVEIIREVRHVNDQPLREIPHISYFSHILVLQFEPIRMVRGRVYNDPFSRSIIKYALLDIICF